MPVKKQKASACKASKARSCMPEICFLNFKNLYFKLIFTCKFLKSHIETIKYILIQKLFLVGLNI